MTAQTTPTSLPPQPPYTPVSFVRVLPAGRSVDLVAEFYSGPLYTPVRRTPDVVASDLKTLIRRRFLTLSPSLGDGWIGNLEGRPPRPGGLVYARISDQRGQELRAALHAQGVRLIRSAAPGVALEVHHAPGRVYVSLFLPGHRADFSSLDDALPLLHLLANDPDILPETMGKHSRKRQEPTD